MLRKPDQNLSRDDFLQLAAGIPTDIKQRISEPLNSYVYKDKDILKPNHSFFDVHSHSFSIDHIPRDFIRLLNWVSNQDKVNLLELINPVLGKFMAFKEPEKVIENLILTYNKSFVRKAIDPKLFIVNLAMDMERGISGNPVFSYKDQLAQLLDILTKKSPVMDTGRNYEYDKTILPFIAIDSNNPDAYDYFLSGFIKDYNNTGIKALDHSAPFLGVKLYPSLGYSPLDPVLLDIYSVCERAGIPITTHCGGLRTRTNKHKVEIGQRKMVQGRLVDTKKVIDVRSKARLKAAFIDPAHWHKVALEFPKLKLNLAHFGDNTEWKNFHKNPHDPSNFVFKTLKMLETHSHVYADISYAYFDEKNRVKIAAMMMEDKYKNRILYGSDFYLTEVEKIRTQELMKRFEENFMHNQEGYHLLTSANPFHFIFSQS